MRSTLFLVLGALLIVSCASKKDQATEYENIPHEHNISSDNSKNKKIAYEGKCAMGVLQDHCDRKADKNISYEYKDVTYFFATEESRNQFVKDIDSNIKKADLIWEKNQRRLDRR